MKKIVKILIFLVVVALLVVGAVRLIKKKKAEEAALPIAKQYAVIVHTITPKPQELKLGVDYLALVQNDKSVTISSKFPARVLEVIKEGSVVHKGQIVARLDDMPVRSKLEATQVQILSLQEQIGATKRILTNLLHMHARTKKLLAVKGASIEQYEKEENQIESTKAKLAALKSRLHSLRAQKKELQNELSYAVLRSEVNGIVAKQMLHVGDLAMPGHRIVRVNTQEGNYLLVRLPKNIKGLSLVYKAKEYPLRPLRSTLNSLQEYRADVSDPELVEGERVKTRVITFKGKGIVLPQDAILDRNGRSYVLIAHGNHASALPVHILASSEEGVVVQEDLSGKKVVVAKPDILLKLLSGIELKEK